MMMKLGLNGEVDDQTDAVVVIQRVLRHDYNIGVAAYIKKEVAVLTVSFRSFLRSV
jgi:hypothetical protein